MIATSSDETVGVDFTFIWKEIALSTSLSAGNYWLLRKGAQEYTSHNFRYDSAGTGLDGTFYFSYNKVWQNPLTSFSDNTRKYSIYATYTEPVVIGPVIGNTYPLPPFKRS